MGWSFTPSFTTRKQQIDYLVNGFSQHDVLAHKSTALGLYVVTEHKVSKQRAIFVALIEKGNRYTGGGYGYKDMDESMGPYGAIDCPLAFFEMVPCPNEWAQAWRGKCREFHRQRAERKGKERYLLIGVKCNGELIAVKPCKPVKASKRKIQSDELSELRRLPGTLVNLGELYR